MSRPWITTDLRVSPSCHDNPWKDCARLCVQFGQLCMTSEASISCVAYTLRCSHLFLLAPPPTHVTLHYFCGGLTKMKEQTSRAFRWSQVSHAACGDLGARMMSPCCPQAWILIGRERGHGRCPWMQDYHVFLLSFNSQCTKCLISLW